MRTHSFTHHALAAALSGVLFCTFGASAFAQSVSSSHNSRFSSISLNAPLQEPCDDPTTKKIRAASPLVVSTPPQDPYCVLSFWDDERMARAEWSFFAPVGLAPDGTLVPEADEAGYFPVYPTHKDYADVPFARVNGMLFYQQPDGTPAHCSASIIQSHSRSVILMAAHCVVHVDGWKRNMMFVPAYNGSESGLRKTPLGRWPVEAAFVPDLNGTPANDVAVARLYPIHDNGYGSEPIEEDRLEDVVGDGLVPYLNADPETFELLALFGYPGNTRYGGKQFECVTHSRPSNSPEYPTMLYTPNCNSVSGNSGGPFIFGTSPGYVVSVVHFGSMSARLTEENFLPIFNAADTRVDASLQATGKSP